MKEFRFPTIIGLFIIIFGLSGSIYLVNQRSSAVLRADLSYQPQKILISNFRPNEFTVSWQTEKKTDGYITYGEEQKLGLISLDIRDKQSKQRGNFIYHYVTVSGLTSKKYYFKIGSKGTLYGGKFSLSLNCQDYISILNNNPFIVNLPNLPLKTVRSIPVSGLLSREEKGENPVGGAIACLWIKDTLPLTNITSNTGSFIIPLYTVIKRDLNLLESITDETNEELYIFGPTNEITFAKFKSVQDHPIPILRLGGNFDFTKKIKIAPSPTSKPTPKEMEIKATPSIEEMQKPTAITTPKINYEPTATPTLKEENLVELLFPLGQITDNIPTFRGKGKAGLIFDIMVESNEKYKDKVKIDNYGRWTWTLPGKLTAGLHSVKIEAKDDIGNPFTFTKTFVIAAANPLLPVFAGTPSATIAPTATIPPTLIPTLPPTSISSQPKEELLPTGATLPFIFILTSAIISIMLGIGMVFSVKK